jgi:leader peptidase (prepilin peptidase)/N-methyltransferase
MPVATVQNQLDYPVMELLTGNLFAFAFYKLGFSMELIVAILFISMLVIITVSDFAYMLIPDKVLLFFGVLLIVARFLSPLEPWWDSIIGAAGGFGILLLIAILSKGGMGGGDIKLFAVIGLVLGMLPTLLTLFLAAFIGAIVGVIHLRVKTRTKNASAFWTIHCTRCNCCLFMARKYSTGI